ncbi:hypothetical protein ACFVP3_36885 [Streptomyces sp. NPDC057806]|uniref:hypothetical protein n=1 Tax=Streptomyces sp. NPDC057806 TaxID=3346255 RepID=UPI0036864ECC
MLDADQFEIAGSGVRDLVQQFRDRGHVDDGRSTRLPGPGARVGRREQAQEGARGQAEDVLQRPNGPQGGGGLRAAVTVLPVAQTRQADLYTPASEMEAQRFQGQSWRWMPGSVHNRGLPNGFLAFSNRVTMSERP